MQYSNQCLSPRGAAIRRLLPLGLAVNGAGIYSKCGVATGGGGCATGGKFLYRGNIHCIHESCFSFCYQTKVFPLSKFVS